MVIVIFIILCIILYFFSFSKANENQKHQLNNQGGMRTKYNRLVTNLLSIDNSFRVLSITATTITIGKRMNNNFVEFHVLHAFTKLHVKWTLQEQNIGHHSLTWEFSENSDQDMIMNEITLRLDRWDKEMADALFGR